MERSVENQIETGLIQWFKGWALPENICGHIGVQASEAEGLDLDRSVSP